MKKFLKWSGIVLAAITSILLLLAFLGKSDMLELNLEKVDLAQIPDGTYTGSFNNFRWINTVEVVITDHKIVRINPIKTEAGRDEMVQELMDRILTQQRSDVDAVSGATASSNGFLKAIETALKNALTLTATTFFILNL